MGTPDCLACLLRNLYIGLRSFTLRHSGLHLNSGPLMGHWHHQSLHISSLEDKELSFPHTPGVPGNWEGHLRHPFTMPVLSPLPYRWDFLWIFSLPWARFYLTLWRGQILPHTHARFYHRRWAPLPRGEKWRHENLTSWPHLSLFSLPKSTCSEKESILHIFFPSKHFFILSVDNSFPGDMKPQFPASIIEEGSSLH